MSYLAVRLGCVSPDSEAGICSIVSVCWGGSESTGLWGCVWLVFHW